MSLIPIILNVLLAVLLMAALLVGWRLERRLKELRQSHLGFAKAVQELDVAALRAQAGLDQLRIAADEAGDVLGDRLIRAREMSEKLQSMIATAQKVSQERRPAPEPPVRVPQSARYIGTLACRSRACRPRAAQPYALDGNGRRALYRTGPVRGRFRAQSPAQSRPIAA